VTIAFDTFVAIDWSGAKGDRHKGISVAVAGPGSDAPRLLSPPAARGWARCEVADWLEAQKGRVLAGFDCLGAAQVAKASFAGMRHLRQSEARPLCMQSC